MLTRRPEGSAVVALRKTEVQGDRGVVECCFSHATQKRGLTPISCHALLERSACAPFIEERRMECFNATNLNRKSGQVGHPTLVADADAVIRSVEHVRE
jgi:hypothetical protein